MQALPVTPGSPTAPRPAQQGNLSNTATNAFGLGFDSLLRIILTQLTYQDPLKPIENFEFVSQLAQFSQIQQGQTSNERLEQLVAAQATTQATSLLGREVDVPAGNQLISGTVTSISFADGAPRATIRTADNRTISNIAINTIVQVRERN